jgi:hypothetical protein
MRWDSAEIHRESREEYKTEETVGFLPEAATQDGGCPQEATRIVMATEDTTFIPCVWK